VRGRQLEGTLTLGPKVGEYVITGMRTSAGWGRVSEKRWPYRRRGDPWPPASEPPGLDDIAKYSRAFAHFRIRDLDDARRCLAFHSPFQLSIPIHNGWHHTSDGVIEMPSSEGEFTGYHCVSIAGYSNATERFKFANSWSRSWGEGGYGYLPYNYAACFMQEAFFFQELPGHGPFDPARLRVTSNQNFDFWTEELEDSDFSLRTFIFRNGIGNPGFVTDIWQISRISLSVLASRRSTRLKLWRQAESERYPVRYWVPFVDTLYRTSNFGVINDLIRLRKLIVKQSGVTWAKHRLEQ
jgi:hypothetical protein